MKYAVLIYARQGALESLSDVEQERVFDEYLALNRERAVLDSEQLQPVQTATAVRVKDGRALTTDGPFADTKEVFAGFYVIEVDTQEQAIEFAARVPASRMGGSVEVRPLAAGWGA